jgi:NtrC-family two-component system sensor histidine kinase KinB
MLRTRLYLGILPLLLILVGVGAYAIRVDRELAGSLSRDLISNYRAISALQRMREAAAQMNNAVRDSQSGNVLALQAAFDTHRSAFMRELMGQSVDSGGSTRAGLVAAIDETFRDFAARGETIFRAGGLGSLTDQRRDSTTLYRVQEAIEALNRRDSAAAQQTAARVDQLAESTEKNILLAIGAAVLLSIFVAWRLAASLLRPIKALTASAVAVGEGDLDRKLPLFSTDELGQLAGAFNTMSAKLREYREATLAKVLRTQRTMEATLTSAPDPVFVVDRDGTHAVRNPAAEPLAAEPDFAGGQFPPALAEPLATVLQTGEHYLPTDYSRAISLHVGRDDRHYLPRILAIGDKLTEFKGAAIILQDVTKFRLLDDAKTNLVGTVSHELKTPLTSLRMAVYLLLEQKLEGLTPTQRELLESARDDADRLLRILDNLLDLARLEAGASMLNRQEVSVGTLLDEIAREARAFIEPSGQTLVVQISADLAKSSLAVDPERLRHVFMNLLTNAAKYSPPGGAITLSARPEPGFVRFGVRDQGQGIPADSVAHVFDRFYRAPDQTKSGAGLGLAIAREIVVAHGGSIACSSTVGEGTEFHFVLPR